VQSAVKAVEDKVDEEITALDRLDPNDTEGQFGRAPKADSVLNLVRALPNNFSERSDSLLILWSDFLK
jgi:hypothetical protein